MSECEVEKIAEIEGLVSGDDWTLLIRYEGRTILRVSGEAGMTYTDVDLFNLLHWLQVHRPDLLPPYRAGFGTAGGGPGKNIAHTVSYEGSGGGSGSDTIPLARMSDVWKVE